MKINFLLLIIILSFVNGCVSYRYNPGALLGVNIEDLKKARETGAEKIVSIPYEEAFKKTLSLLQNNGLTIYQKSKRKRYIIAMDFTKQVNTTRAGIFFDILPENKTKITISSLSKTTLQKAEQIVFSKI